ncbi:hydroxyacid dehydrogenase [Streptantibioticus parmotrematis]|uniref:hydroxyacid dehydrogenase n=1 Tax=Streptantibioticus parmotrematis TaxID=2873249 RepID=UPI0033DDA4F1
MGGTQRRPGVVLAMAPDVRDALLDEAARARLLTLADAEPALAVTDFADPAHAERLAAAEALLTCWGCPPLTAEALERMPRLRTVVHAAGSVKGHVTDACWERGLTVCCVASANAVAVAEFTLAAILFSGKRVIATAAAYREHRAAPDTLRAFAGLGNHGRTVGVVGASRIGRKVIELLRPFDLRVLVYDPYVTGVPGAESVGLAELVRRSDVVTLHAPQLPSTRGMFGRELLASMRDGATLVNTARGSLVDTGALTEELVSGRLHAVLDHTEPEVLPAGSPLYDLPNVLLTPHVAGSLGTELSRLAHAALDELERWTAGEPYAEPVTADRLGTMA